MILETAGDEYLPRNLEAEQAVIGSLLLDSSAIIEVNGTLRPDDFANDAHSVIYRVMVDLYEQSRPVDLITVLDEVERRDLLQRAGGRGYLLSLVDVVPTAIHVEHYTKIVERLAILRRLIGAGSQIMGIAQREGIEVEDALSRSEETLLSVSQRRGTAGFVPVHDVLASILERLDYVHEHRGAIVGTPTGFIDLDKILGGLQRSDLIILGARPAHGKTALALGMCHNAAVRYKQRVALFSLEMSKEQLVQRLLCMQGRLDSGRLRSGYIDEDEWTRLIEAASVLSEAKIFIDDSAGVSPAEMRNRARRLQAEQGLDLIVVDYLQLMSGRATENRVQEISGISRALKVLARELNVPVMALSQVSRGVDSRTSHVPLLSDLRESGSIEQDADVVIFLCREEMYDAETEKQHIADLYVAKHRNGPTGQLSLYFDKIQTRFRDLEAQPL
ncbi:MAG: replicative helicase [Chloroflexi bacterium]|nr:replicative helicase [Chloroflexota bacterium]MDB5077514.1 replicative helicase [Chloroflexota bacterium]